MKGGHLNWQNIITSENIDKHYGKYVKIHLHSEWYATAHHPLGPTFVDTVYEELQYIRDYNSGIFKLVKMNLDNEDEWDLDEIWIEPDLYDLGNIYARLETFHPSYLGGRDNEADLEYYLNNPAGLDAPRDDIPYYVEIPKNLKRVFMYDDIGYYVELYDPFQEKIKTKKNILDRTQKRKQNKLDKESFKEFTKGISVSKDSYLSKLGDKNIQYNILKQMNVEPKHRNVLKSEIDKKAFNEFTKGISVSKDNDLSKLKDKDIQKNILKQLSKYQGGKLIEGGKLIGEGSKTCVFRPNLPCKNKNIKTSDKNVSKVFLNNKDIKYLDEEINFNEKISKLKNSNIWTVTLYNKCELNDYKNILKIEKDLNKCLQSQNISIKEYNENKFMLYGLYGGINMNEEVDNIFKKFNTKSIISFLKKTHSLFYGLTIMKKNKIIHYDIKSGNIVYNENKFKYIDFGISTTFNNITKIKKRALKEYKTSRIYIYYPFDIFFTFLDNKTLDNEIKYKNFNKRKNYENLKEINNLLFNRNIDDDIINNIKDIKNKKINQTKIIELLDIYSLGITLSLILIEKLNLHFYSNIDIFNKNIRVILDHPTIKPIIDLLKNMTEISANNRITPKEALKELEKILNYKPKY